jgi:hypothetical protein
MSGRSARDDRKNKRPGLKPGPTFTSERAGLPPEKRAGRRVRSSGTISTSERAGLKPGLYKEARALRQECLCH